MPGPYRFGAVSERELATCDERLQRLFRQVIKGWNCRIRDGKRTEEEAAQTQVDGASKTNRSKHVYPIGKPSLAADVDPWPVDWKDTNRYYAFAGYVLGIAVMMEIKIRWGGDWDSDRDLHDQTLYDLGHFEVVE
jgi:peptidoglycan LD-endopeptidase CwlK